MSRSAHQLRIVAMSLLLGVTLASILRRRDRASSQDSGPQAARATGRPAVFDRIVALVSAAAAVVALILGQQAPIIMTSAAPGGNPVSPSPTVSSSNPQLSEERAAAVAALLATLGATRARATPPAGRDVVILDSGLAPQALQALQPLLWALRSQPRNTVDIITA